MIKLFLAIVTLSFPLVPLPAQNRDDYERYMQESGSNSVLFRGSSPLLYSFKYTGTFFAYSPIFEKGELRYNGKNYHNVEMNLNSHLDELYVKFNGSAIVVTLNDDLTENFNIGNRFFVNLKGDDKQGSPTPGFYQVLYRGNDVLYKKIKKTYQEQITQSYTEGANNKLERYFKTSETYYLLKGNSYFIIKNRLTLMNLYKNEKRELGRFVRESNLNFYDFKDESYVSIMNFVESGKR